MYIYYVFIIYYYCNSTLSSAAQEEKLGGESNFRVWDGNFYFTNTYTAWRI